MVQLCRIRGIIGNSISGLVLGIVYRGLSRRNVSGCRDNKG